MDINENIEMTNGENLNNSAIANGVAETENNTQEVKEEIGAHDIVIEEDFQINMEVSEISSDISGISSNSTGENTAKNEEINIGTEQSGNITF